MRKFFSCECSGCRGYRVQFEDNRYNSYRAIESVKGHYLSAGAMRFFGSRVSNFYPLESRGAVFFLTQKAGFEDSQGRVRSWAVYCPYGNLLDDLKTDLRPKVTAKSLRDFQEIRINGGFDELVKHCVCHGCQIDRNGWRDIKDAEICIDCPTHCAGE
jgi:hypothetical protein